MTTPDTLDAVIADMRWQAVCLHEFVTDSGSPLGNVIDKWAKRLATLRVLLGFTVHHDKARLARELASFKDSL